MSEKEEGISLKFNDEGEAEAKETGPYRPTCPGDKTDCENFDYIEHENYYETFCHIAQASPFHIKACPKGKWWFEGYMPAPEYKVIPATDEK